MAHIDSKKLDNAIAVCVVVSMYWFLVICRLLYYFLRGS